MLSSRVSSRARAVIGFALLVVSWSALILVPETIQALRGRESDPALLPSGWLLGGPQTQPLREFLGQVDRRLPRGALIAVRTSHSGFEAHYVRMWCAYFLPRHQVVPLSQLRESRAVYDRGPIYLLTYPPQAEGPAGAPEILTSETATLHRLPTGEQRKSPTVGAPGGSESRAPR